MKIQMLGVAAVTVLLLTLGAGDARADLLYNLNVDNCTGGCNPGAPGTSMGTVTLHDVVAGNVLVTVSLVSPLKFVNSGLDDVIDFNITGSPTITVDGFTNNNFELNSGTAGSHHFDGFGNFQYSIGFVPAVGSGAGSAQASPLSFNVHASGLTAASFTTNSTGWFFGVDVINTITGRTGPIGTGSGGTLSTGGGEVPEPASIVLLGTLVLGFTAIRRKMACRAV
jgi:hypothetical protein